LAAALRSGCLAAALVGLPSAMACGGGDPIETSITAPTEIQTPIFRVNYERQFAYISRARLDGSERLEYGHHQFEDDDGEFELRAMSADRRFALFEYGPGAGKRKNLLLFDARSGSETIVLTLPRAERLYGDFSPDGSKLAIYAFDHEPGLYLIDTRSGESRAFPPTGSLEGDGSPAFSVPYWSQDGSALFVSSIGTTHEYFRLDESSAKFRRVRGWKATDTHRYGVVDRPEFLLRGRRTAMQPEIEPQSGVLSDTASSPGGTLATIDANDVLWVKSKERSRRVFQMPPDPPPRIEPNGDRVTLACGSEFGIQGWIGDRVLLYRVDSSIYGYDIDRDASFLVSSGYKVGEYWW
jgi:hypothetical protein